MNSAGDDCIPQLQDEIHHSEYRYLGRYRNVQVEGDICAGVVMWLVSQSFRGAAYPDILQLEIELSVR